MKKKNKILKRLFGLGSSEMENPERERFQREVMENKLAVAQSIASSKSFTLLKDLLDNPVAKEVLVYSLFISSPDLICIADVNRLYLVSPSFTRLLGWEEAELLCTDCWHLFIHDDDVGALRRILIRKDADHTVVRTRAKTKSGANKWIEWSINSAKNGEVRYYMIGRDITDMIETTNALVESESRFRGAFESAAIGMALCDQGGNLIKVNRAICDVLGYTDDELLSKNYLDITFEDDIRKSKEHVAAMLAGEVDKVNLKKRYVHKDGSVIWAYTSVALVQDADGNTLYFISQLQDMTKLITTHNKLKVTAHRLEMILAHIVDGVISIDEDHKIAYPLNEAAAEMFGYTTEELVGEDIAVLMPEKYRERHRHAVEVYKDGGVGRVVGKIREVEGLRKDGSTFQIELSVSEVLLSGKYLFTAILRDVSARGPLE